MNESHGDVDTVRYEEEHRKRPSADDRYADIVLQGYACNLLEHNSPPQLTRQFKRDAPAAWHLVRHSRDLVIAGRPFLSLESIRPRQDFVLHYCDHVLLVDAVDVFVQLRRAIVPLMAKYLLTVEAAIGVVAVGTYTRAFAELEARFLASLAEGPTPAGFLAARHDLTLASTIALLQKLQEDGHVMPVCPIGQSVRKGNSDWVLCPPKWEIRLRGAIARLGSMVGRHSRDD